ncbi:hypothetical protein TIFTF001_046532 [Ficus carica]|uniref:Uncharacterized protein n=1 Tax=Ficus carica TaxID=3494 RepID=A0AA87ZCT1_FICCA|nr:hypothetical protein TIFTF001_046531 [Ficus carica]GMN31622.1 hypothetical protein TIFTF001_046532 [Ficus carica]
MNSQLVAQSPAVASFVILSTATKPHCDKAKIVCEKSKGREEEKEGDNCEGPSNGANLVGTLLLAFVPRGVLEEDIVVMLVDLVIDGDCLIVGYEESLPKSAASTSGTAATLNDAVEDPASHSQPPSIQGMSQIYIIVEYNGKWEKVDGGFWRWFGVGMSKGFVVDRSIKFLELEETIYDRTSIDRSMHAIEITHKSVGDIFGDTTTPTLISNDSDIIDLMFFYNGSSLGVENQF